MELLGYFAAIIIGVILGLIGGGGSALSVPVLVYVFGISPIIGTAYSLFIVGVTTFVGAISAYRKRLINIKIAIAFAAPSLVTVYLVRLFLLPNIPNHLFQVGQMQITKSIGIMLFFAFIMGVASISMIRKSYQLDPNVSIDENESIHQIRVNSPLIIIAGITVGILAGVVGAGGGFLIIPALVVLARVPIKMAVGTSLMIICANSILGFIGDIQAGQLIDWSFLLPFTGLSIVGIIIGRILSVYISSNQLKFGFGWFVLIMAIFILVKELLLV